MCFLSGTNISIAVSGTGRSIRPLTVTRVPNLGSLLKDKTFDDKKKDREPVETKKEKEKEC